jgi:hypothetical protein
MMTPPSMNNIRFSKVQKHSAGDYILATISPAAIMPRSIPYSVPDQGPMRVVGHPQVRGEASSAAGVT